MAYFQPRSGFSAEETGTRILTESSQELGKTMQRVLIVDAFPIWRDGVRAVISAGKNFDTIIETVEEAQIRSVIEKRGVDLVILDLNIPGGDGLEILRMIKRLDWDLPVLVVSALREELYGVIALKEGAAGYLTKRCTSEELLCAVKMVAAGKKYVSEQLTQRLAKYIQSGNKVLPHERLTMREFQVMLMLGQGMSLKDVSDKLSLSYTTVATHKSRILIKMELQSVAQIVRYVTVQGLVG